MVRRNRRSELLTEQTARAILPLLAGEATLGEVARLWGVVYVGNIPGATVCAALIWLFTATIGLGPGGDICITHC